MKKYPKIYRDFLIISVLLIVVVFLVLNCFVLNYMLSSEIDKVERTEVVYQNVVFLGDSITEGFDLETFDDTNYVLINSGYSGNTSEDILNNLYKRVLQYKPQKVFLLIGTNDIGFGKEKDKTISNIKKTIDRIKEEDIELYVESIYPVNKKIKKNKVGKRTNKVIKEINLAIEDYCKENDVEYLDLYSVLSDEVGNLKEEYTIDGLHLSKDGYRIVKEFLQKYLP